MNSIVAFMFKVLIALCLVCLIAFMFSLAVLIVKAMLSTILKKNVKLCVIGYDRLTKEVFPLSEQELIKAVESDEFKNIEKLLGLKTDEETDAE